MVLRSRVSEIQLRYGSRALKPRLIQGKKANVPANTKKLKRG